jgi:hypothetical protein
MLYMGTDNQCLGGLLNPKKLAVVIDFLTPLKRKKLNLYCLFTVVV